MNLNKQLKKIAWESYLHSLEHIRKLWKCRKWGWAKKRLKEEIVKARELKENLRESGSKFKRTAPY